MELRPERSRRGYLGNPNRVRDTAVQSVAVTLRPGAPRCADAPGPRKVRSRGRLLYDGSPTDPGSPGSGIVCPRSVALPEAILRCPKLKKCPFRPFFRHHPGSMGKLNSMLRAYTLFRTFGSAPRRPASPRFSAGKFRPMRNRGPCQKYGVLLFIIAPRLSNIEKKTNI